MSGARLQIDDPNPDIGRYHQTDAPRPVRENDDREWAYVWKTDNPETVVLATGDTQMEAHEKARKKLEAIDA